MLDVDAGWELPEEVIDRPTVPLTSKGKIVIPFSSHVNRGPRTQHNQPLPTSRSDARLTSEISLLVQIMTSPPISLQTPNPHHSCPPPPLKSTSNIPSADTSPPTSRPAMPIYHSSHAASSRASLTQAHTMHGAPSWACRPVCHLAGGSVVESLAFSYNPLTRRNHSQRKHHLPRPRRRRPAHQPRSPPMAALLACHPQLHHRLPAVLGHRPPIRSDPPALPVHILLAAGPIHPPRCHLHHHRRDTDKCYEEQ